MAKANSADVQNKQQIQIEDVDSRAQQNFVKESERIKEELLAMEFDEQSEEPDPEEAQKNVNYKNFNEIAYNGLD